MTAHAGWSEEDVDALVQLSRLIQRSPRCTTPEGPSYKVVVNAKIVGLIEAAATSLASLPPAPSVRGGVEAPKVHCKARNAYPDPLDCDWPWCGCDPSADRVLEAIQECGKTIVDEIKYNRDMEELEALRPSKVAVMVDEYVRSHSSAPAPNISETDALAEVVKQIDADDLYDAADIVMSENRQLSIQITKYAGLIRSLQTPSPKTQGDPK